MSKKNFLKLFWVLFIILPFSCSDAPEIPYVPVYIDINIYMPDYIELQTVGNAIYITGGVYKKGIIVYRSTFDEFLAYDRTCGYHPEDPCGRVNVDDMTLNAVCDCCGSKYQLGDGYVVEGPSRVPLTSYDATAFDVLTGTLTIRNWSMW